MSRNYLTKKLQKLSNVETLLKRISFLEISNTYIIYHNTLPFLVHYNVYVCITSSFSVVDVVKSTCLNYLVVSADLPTIVKYMTSVVGKDKEGDFGIDSR